NNADVDGAWGDATAWVEILEQAGPLLDVERLTVDRGLGRDTGMSLGCSARRAGVPRSRSALRATFWAHVLCGIP
ncbi:MAG TPA: hypothetical protein VK988_15000, partial [Acidimicrobiales bacterium]|nr:hypothetical protein [Acidimicrobiales bacterium]